MRKTMKSRIFLCGAVIVLIVSMLTACPMTPEEEEPEFTSGAVTALTSDIEAPGDIDTPYGEQWFKFTATASTQYITIMYDTLTDVYIQLYTKSGSTVGSQVHCYIDPPYTGTFFEQSVKSGDVYYIKVKANSGSGTYRLMFSNSPLSLKERNEATELTFNTWENGASTDEDNELFKFTATAATQYIHIKCGTLTDMMLRTFDSNGSIRGGVDNDKHLSGSNSGYWISLPSLSVGQAYYISIWPYSSSGSGTYRIAFNESQTAPN
jgi:hypothetical protein